jgi:hypothetical protein
LHRWVVVENAGNELETVGQRAERVDASERYNDLHDGLLSLRENMQEDMPTSMTFASISEYHIWLRMCHMGVCDGSSLLLWEQRVKP